MLGYKSEEGLKELVNGDGQETVEFLSVYTQGTDDKSVALIQERLMQLGFMDFAEPTEHYGPVTMDAVKRFQRQNDLKQDGIIGEQTIGILFEDNAKSYLLKKGMDGDDIKNVQDRLYELGYLAKKDQITGHFGDDTDAAVKALQKANQLTTDGKIGVETFELLYSENVKANLISFGDKSDIVLECQKRLKELGYLTTTPDGYYGDDTLAAVKQFQSRNDCIVDGYLGPSTRAVLISSSAKPNGLVLGDQNDTVKKVQKLLIKYGYLASGSDTGYFGELTEAAVKKFQQKNGLSADGNVGQKTMAKLTGENVVKATGGNGGGNGGNGGGDSGDGGDGGGKVSYSTSPDDLIAVARTKLGKKYVYGSKGPNTFDCSGFVYWCLNQIGVNQSYITSSGWRTVGKYKKITDFSKMKKGDIIVVYGHVGIAISNSRVIDASSSNGKIVERDMGDWWKRNFICAWRIFDE
ncbi:MAG: peptidoglycan-binding protein [Lachnospiraceae bacterium]|nr:peptidoglycan-binding protein [Lachnospiraceae bacterium]